jgi:(2Fe-2S) ferredoxin
MRLATLAPRLHFLVCANRREADSPLGPGCAAAGDAVFEALKREVASRRCFGDVWITKTLCLGVCPREGATVASYPAGEFYTETVATEAPRLFEQELTKLHTDGESR